MAGQRGAGGVVTGHQVRHAGWQPGLVDAGEQQGGGEGGVRRRLDDDGAPRRDRRTQLPADELQRVVPRRDRADDADRFAHDQAREAVGVVRDDLAVDPRGLFGVEVERRGELVDLPGRLADRLAHLRGDRLGQLALTGFDPIPDRVQVPCADRRVDVSPFSERGTCGGHGGVDLRPVRVRDGGDDLVVGGVPRLEGGLAGNPFPVDVVVDGLRHDVCLCRRSQLIWQRSGSPRPARAASSAASRWRSRIDFSE